jgi:hypothetical protein
LLFGLGALQRFDGFGWQVLWFEIKLEQKARFLALVYTTTRLFT